MVRSISLRTLFSYHLWNGFGKEIGTLIMELMEIMR